MAVVTLATIAVGTAGAVGQASAQDLAAGKKLFKKTCRACHGPKAQGMASFPKLAGNTEEYLTSRLEQYRAGEKLGPNTPLMAPKAAKLSDDDISNVVSFIVKTFK